MVSTAELRERAQRIDPTSIAPVVLAREQTLTVPAPFENLLPRAGLQRGWMARVEGGRHGRALAWALLADITRSGGWIAAVDVPGINLAAAGEVGVAIERVLVVTSTDAETWSATLGALIGAVDVIVFGAPSHRVTPSAHRRIASRCRERGTVMIELADPTSRRSAQLQYDLVFDVAPATWHGIGQGHGRLVARELDVSVSGRRSPGRPRTGRFALPDATGAVRLLDRPAPPTLSVVRPVAG